MGSEISETMLAPCGMNCFVCYTALRKRKPCTGCRTSSSGKPTHCRECRINDCVQERGLEYCFACSDYPCAVIKRLDKSYRKRYQVSLIENAARIKSLGATAFLEEEKIKWMCTDCSGVISLHDQVCSECGEPYQPGCHGLSD